MRQLFHCAAVTIALAVTCVADSRIGGIEFFGYGGLDLAAIRRALPLSEGDRWADDNREILRESVRAVAGTDATDIAVVCCDEDGDRWIYVGLAGSTSKRIHFLDEPVQPVRLAQELLLLHAKLEKTLITAVERGGEAIQEDGSRGYALTRDATARSLELQIRKYALANGPQVFAALTDSSDALHRAIAAQTAGYAEHTAEQVHVLSRAIRDPDRVVRNNAIRALAVLASSDVELAAPIDASLFTDLLFSGTWADRHKSVAVLRSLTRSRDDRILAEIKERSLDP